MNPLEEYPHLFRNGKFRVKGRNDIFVFLVKDIIDEYYWKDFTLIARPIEDMTDEELQKTVSHRHHGTESIQQLKYDLQDGGQYTEDTLYLLSIGVYPFDQQHFEDGTVIDSRTI